VWARIWAVVQQVGAAIRIQSEVSHRLVRRAFE
jgi:hypothetical protein